LGYVRRTKNRAAVNFFNRAFPDKILSLSIAKGLKFAYISEGYSWPSNTGKVEWRWRGCSLCSSNATRRCFRRPGKMRCAGRSPLLLIESGFMLSHHLTYWCKCFHLSSSATCISSYLATATPFSISQQISHPLRIDPSRRLFQEYSYDYSRTTAAIIQRKCSQAVIQMFRWQKSTNTFYSCQPRRVGALRWRIWVLPWKMRSKIRMQVVLSKWARYRATSEASNKAGLYPSRGAAEKDRWERGRFNQPTCVKITCGCDWNERWSRRESLGLKSLLGIVRFEN